MNQSASSPPIRWRLSHPAVFAIAALLTVGVTVLLAHEGHAPLPTKGIQVDVARGHLLLTPAARDSLAITTAEVEVKPVEGSLLAYATVELPWTHHGFATARLPGRIVKVLVTPGQIVLAGDVVAEVKSLDLDTLQLEALTAYTEAGLAQKVMYELRNSVASGTTPEQSLFDAEKRLAQAKNSIAVSRSRWIALGLAADSFDALLKSGKVDPGLTLPIRVPVGGTVIHAELTAGKVVEPAEHLIEVADLSTVWVRVGVLEKDFARVSVGSPVDIRLTALPGEVFRTTVAAVAPYLNPVTHLGSVWAELKNPSAAEPRVVPGMTGRAGVILPAERPRPTVPISAVAREGVDRFVFVEEAKAAGASEYRKKPVAVGRRNGDQIEVLAGELFPGDRVVVRGTHELSGLFAPGVLRLAPEAERAIGLRMETAMASSVDDTVTLDGAVDLPPSDRGSASSPLPGVIARVRAERGQAVKAGDVLAEVVSAELLTLQLDLVRASLDLDLESATLARIKDLPAVAKRRVWETEGRVTSLKSQVDTLRRKLETVGFAVSDIDGVVATKQVLSAVPVRSPISGVIVTFEKALGQAVAAQEVLFSVHDRNRPLVMAAVSERDMGRVRIGQPVRARFVTDPDTVLTGRVARSGRMVGAGSRSLAVWVELDTGGTPPLLHGQLADVTVVTGSHPAAVTVPRGTVAGEPGSEVVFVRRPDGVFERRTVETGRVDDRVVEVVRGLSSGERVAVAGVSELVTGFSSLR
ncbi:MAG: efflux RND transporter periplasmic adaptor subunit [Gemmataceae bacterium]|nr:efflux RND transporter periplasmic adaptor subunit [Gemmataceae bacterium]